MQEQIDAMQRAPHMGDLEHTGRQVAAQSHVGEIEPKAQRQSIEGRRVQIAFIG